MISRGAKWRRFEAADADGDANGETDAGMAGGGESEAALALCCSCWRCCCSCCGDSGSGGDAGDDNGGGRAWAVAGRAHGGRASRAACAACNVLKVKCSGDASAAEPLVLALLPATSDGDDRAGAFCGEARVDADAE